MYWYRIEQSLGRNSIVGTTVRNPNDLPQHLVADEKHTWISGEKVYVATTVGEECILGVSIAKDAGEESLTKAYGVFKKETQCLYLQYSPLTVNLDGAEMGIRGWALILNFVPSNPETIKKYGGLQSPAERLNQFRYHDNWLHNLLISASSGGFRNTPQKAL
ncbi:MAG: hypothetical protein HQK76_14780 [Desulfobacterales bacterium]|nr:hypothetical protein [Desulfobacterales bacterium]